MKVGLLKFKNALFFKVAPRAVLYIKDMAKEIIYIRLVPMLRQPYQKYNNFQLQTFILIVIGMLLLEILIMVEPVYLLFLFHLLLIYQLECQQVTQKQYLLLLLLFFPVKLLPLVKLQK